MPQAHPVDPDRLAATQVSAWPALPHPSRREADAVYRRGAVAVATVRGRLRHACLACGKRATFGRRWPCGVRACTSTLHCGPRWCAAHAPPGTFDVANLRCSVSDCGKQRAASTPFCAAHRTATRALFGAVNGCPVCASPPPLR